MADKNLLNLSLKIQLSATAVASSLLLIFVPNVETISLMAFLLGFIFPISYAIETILVMVVTWEIFASMVFGFSGITFPFKIVAWIIVGFLGNSARKVSAKYFYEFMIFGGLAALIFDTIVTISTAFFFLSDIHAFSTVLLTSLFFGIPFTISHTVANGIFFSFIPMILRTILPMLHDYNEELIVLPRDYFNYLENETIRSSNWAILKLDRRRILLYTLSFILILSLLGVGIYQAYFVPTHPPDNNTAYNINLNIDYDGVIPPQNYTMTLNSSLTALQILEKVAIVIYTTKFLSGIPYIQAINGVWENKNITGNYWFILVNDNFVNTGANSTYLTNGDVLLWKYQ